MFQQTRPLYVKPFLGPPPLPILYWPRLIYCATKSSGVFYTGNFDDPSQQPIWTAINDGLGALNCREFHLDPFDEVNRQFVLIETGATLYMRTNGGAWVDISNLTTRGDLTGDYLTTRVGGFYLDPTIQGRIWLTMSSPSCEYSFVSDDYGTSWTPGVIYAGTYAQTSTVRARGDFAWSCDAAGPGAYGYVLWTSDKGIRWYWQSVDLVGLPQIEYNPLVAYSTYYGTPQFGHTLGRFRDKMDYAVLRRDICLSKPGCMWYDPDDVNHQRLVWNDRLYVTNDNWVTISDAGAISTDFDATKRPDEIIAPWCGAIERMMISTQGAHVISALLGEDDIVAQGIAGQFPTVAPYISSIPQFSVSGGVCNCGIQCPKEEGFDYQ